MINIDLESDRLEIKRLTTEHVNHNYLSWLNDPEINAFLEVNGDYTMCLLEEYVKKMYKNETYFWAIHIKATGKHIGNIKIDPINLDKNSGEYGILMGDKSVWGKGYAEEASLSVINFCFEKLELSKITLGVIEGNTRAIRLYRKMGFKIQKKEYDKGFYNGKLRNSLRMYILNEKQ